MENAEALFPVDGEHAKLSADQRAQYGPAIGSLLFIRGRIIHMTAATTLIRTNASYVTVRWFAGRVPPDVRLGEVVHVVGNFVTASCGESWMVFDAMTIRTAPSEYSRRLRELMQSSLLLPKDWIDDLP